MNIKSILTASAFPLLLSAQIATAQTIDVKVTNLTQGIFFTPLLLSAHNATTHLFEAGQAASSELQAMAEGGDIAGLVTAATAVGAVNSENPAAGLLAPSSATMVSALDTGSNTHLSIVAMLLPTNDGFVGLNGWEIPQTAGTYRILLNGYDAGTEANDEKVIGDAGGAPGVLGIPANPGGNGGTGATGVTTTETNKTVHIHPGNLGDTDTSAGISDVDSRVHRWLNPVAEVIVTVK